MNTSLRKDILTETYEDMQNLVYKTAWNFYRKYGGDIEDLIGQANLIFIHAVDHYDENKGTEFTTWLVNDINYWLRIYMRDERRQIYLPLSSVLDNEDINFDIPVQDDFSVLELLDEIEKDAHTIIQLFLDTPKDAIEEYMYRAKGKKGRHFEGFMKRRLKNRLRQMGWTITRIKEAFNEIKEVIAKT